MLQLHRRLGRLWAMAVRHQSARETPRLTRASRPNITIFFTLLAVGVAFGWLGVEDPSQWREGTVLYILGRQSFPVQILARV
jgi:hypothetical protein